jgi:hypothetical protein
MDAGISWLQGRNGQEREGKRRSLLADKGIGNSMRWLHDGEVRGGERRREDDHEAIG